jgi:inner membrane protein YidH
LGHVFHSPSISFLGRLDSLPAYRPIGKRARRRGGIISARQLAEVQCMIKRYSDHAANERTFLAWVRTAIAVMAFGFLIERFDLFLRYITPQLAQRQLAPHGQAFANWAGLAFIVLGVAMIVLAGLRFAKTAKEIETDDEVASPGARFDLALAAMVGLLGASLFLYMMHAVLPGI